MKHSFSLTPIVFDLRATEERGVIQSSEQDAQYCADPGSIRGHANFLGWGGEGVLF